MYVPWQKEREMKDLLLQNLTWYVNKQENNRIVSKILKVMLKKKTS